MLFLLRDQDLFSHQPLVPTKGYLSVVGAHRASAAPGAVWVAILWGWKQVMPLLLRPRLHEIHHRAVPGKAEKMENMGGGVTLPSTCSVTLLNDWVKEGQRVTYWPEWMARFWPMYLISCEGPWAQMHWVAQASADLASRSSQIWGKKGHPVPQGTTTIITTVSRLHIFLVP